jgi:Transposase/Transposase IS116/IS110/IS902 family
MIQATSEELIVSLDRSDASLAVALLSVATGRLEHTTVSTKPEELDAWWRGLQAAHPGARLLVAFEQPAPNLLAFFAARPPAAIYALNPSATWAYRQSLVVSHARTDQSDAHHQALYILHHRDQLTPWTPPPRTVEQLGRMCEARRKFVDTRTGLTNRLQAVLKRYYPQALEIMHEDIWRPLNLAFLRRWPSPQTLAAARPATLQRFFHQQGSRSQARWERRAQVCAALVPLSPEEPVSDLLEVAVLAGQLEALNAGILRYDQAIAELFARCEDAALIEALPGAGPAMAPRLYVAFARYAGVCESAEAFAAAVGIAPVTDQSGKMRKVYRRLRCDKHTRQSFVEWARESIKHSVWARAFFDQRKAAGHYAQAIFRALAYKWTRILWRCWRERSAYDEAKYLATLRAKGSPLLKDLPADSILQPA